jgi:hypothetical protein
MLPGESSMTCKKPIQIHDNRYGREMVGYSAGFEPATRNLKLEPELSMIIRTNFCTETIKVSFFDSELLESLK